MTQSSMSVERTVITLVELTQSVALWNTLDAQGSQPCEVSHNSQKVDESVTNDHYRQIPGL